MEKNLRRIPNAEKILYDKMHNVEEELYAVSENGFDIGCNGNLIPRM